MLVDKKILLVKKYFKKQKEINILELIIKNYNNSNFLIALVYNRNINKFKVAYLPLDIIDSNKIGNYICYQFINTKMVEYMLENIKKEKARYKTEKQRNNLNTNINNFYIEFNILLNKEVYSLKTTKYIPKKWLFLFEPIVILFEHTPNIMGELCNEILSVISDIDDPIDYKASVNFDLFEDDIANLFDQKTKDLGEKYYQEKEVKFLEKVNGKYFGIVKNHLIIIEYNHRQKLLNLYCDCHCKDSNKHTYAALISIRNKEFNEFFKIMIVDNENEFKKEKFKAKYYLCFGIDNNNLKVIDHSRKMLLPLSLVDEKRLKIISDKDHMLENMIKDYLDNKYSSEKSKELYDQIKSK